MKETKLTVRAAISQVKTPNKAVNADSRMTNKYVYSLLRKHRDFLIKQVDSKFQLLKLGYLFQTWKCVELIPAPTVDECCGVKTSCIIYRTKKKLPYVLTASWGPIIRKVSSLDGFTEFFMTTPSQWNRQQEDTNAKYNKTLYFYWSDGYLYFPNIEWKKVKIDALFEEDIEKFNECCEEVDPCLTFLDNTFRIPKESMKSCIDLVNLELLQEYQRLQPDEDQIDKNDNKKE